MNPLLGLLSIRGVRFWMRRHPVLAGLLAALGFGWRYYQRHRATQNPQGEPAGVHP